MRAHLRTPLLALRLAALRLVALRLVTLLPPLLLALPARAGNDDEIFVGNQAAMAAGAVAATVSDSSATWYNPAGLGASGLDQIDVSGTVYSLRAYQAPGFLQSTTGQRDDASVVEFVSVPSQIAYVRRLGEGLSLGLGYFVPQASNLVLRESLDAQAGAQDLKWQVALNSVRIQHTAAAALSLRLSEHVRAGFSLVGTYQAETESISIVALSSENQVGTRFLAATQLGTVSFAGLEVGAGFQFELAPEWRLGVNLRSARLLLYKSRHVIGATGMADLLSDQGTIQALIEEPQEESSGVHAIRAGRACVGIARVNGKGDWVSFELDVQPGITNPTAQVERHAVVNARLGAYHRLTERVAIGAGVFTDRSPDPPPRDALSGYGDFYGGTLGLEFQSLHRLAGERSERLSFTSTFALRYAFSDGHLNDILVDPEQIDSLGAADGGMIVHELGFYVGGGLSF